MADHLRQAALDNWIHEGMLDVEHLPMAQGEPGEEFVFPASASENKEDAR